MDDKFPLRVAVDQAWTVHRANHNDIDAGDRCRRRERDTLANHGRLVKAIQKN